MMLDRLGYADERVAIQRAFHEQHDLDAMADAVSDEMIDEMALAGTPDDVRTQLERYADMLTFPTLYTADVGPSRTVPQDHVRDNLRSIIDVFAQ